MRGRWFRAVAVSCIGVLPAIAHAIQGAATLEGVQVLRVQRCSKAKSAVSVTLGVGSGGDWKATTADGTFMGAYVTPDTTGRRAILDFDDASEAAFLALQAQTAGVLCGDAVTIDQATPRQFLLRLNGKHTKAKLLLKYDATGSTGATQGTAKYKLAAKGIWRDGPQLDCAGLLTCIGGCPDDACFQACVADATPQGLADYQALSSCVLALCAPDDFKCVDAAVAGPCANEAAACL